MKLPLGLLAISACLSALSCKGDRGEYGPGSAVSVTVEPVKMQESSPSVMVPGVLMAHDRAEVKLPHIAKIAEVFVNKGERVAKGAALARLSDEEVSLKLNQLRSAQREAATLLEKNAYLLKNRDKLLEEGKMDRTQYEGVQIEAASNEAVLNKIKTDIAVEEYNSAHLDVTSPIGGTVLEKYASPMQMAGENQVLFVIVNTDPILVSFALTSDEAGGIRLGTPIMVKIEDLGGDEYQGQVTFIGPELHQMGKTFDVWASIPNPNYTLKGGMLATAQFTSTRTHKVFVVPESAVITRSRDKFVFTVEKGTARRNKVNIRNIYSGNAEISSGLNENDLVVVKGAQHLQDGATVEMWRR